MKNAYKIRLSIAVTVFVLAVLGLWGIFYPVKVLDLQFAPLLQRVFVDFSVIALVLFLLLAVVTVLFGRLYCSTICPLGILQELAALVVKKKNKAIPNYPVKYFILAIVLVSPVLEPYKLFCSAFDGYLLGIVAVLAILAIVFFKNRFFCTNICPVGALLGLISKFSVNKIYIDQSTCVSCGMCERTCPSGCINSKEKSVDNETCVKCLKCLNVCPKSGLKFGKKPKSEEKFSIKRRQLIIGTAVVAVFGGMFKACNVLKEKIVLKIQDCILPAGAVSKERFMDECYNCNLCVQNCPNKILVRGSDEGIPFVHIDYSKGFCKFDCAKCGEVCPTGAIKRLSLEEKQNTRIAMAMISNDKCTQCGLCVEACPKGAIIKVEGKTILNAQKCIGCGACKNACKSDAIEIFPIKEQKKI